MTLRTTLRQSCSMYLVNFLADNGLAVIPETAIVEGSISGKECFVVCGKSSYKCTILGQGKQCYLILVCLHILCNKGDESSLKDLEKKMMDERREGEPPPSKKAKLVKVPSSKGKRKQQQIKNKASLL